MNRLEKILGNVKDLGSKISKGCKSVYNEIARKPAEYTLTGILGLTSLAGAGCNDALFWSEEEEQYENIMKISEWRKFPEDNGQVGVEATYNLVITNAEPGDQTLWYHIDWDYDGTFVADESVEFTVLGNDMAFLYPTHTFTEPGIKTSWIKVDIAPGETPDSVDNESDYTVIVDP